MTFEKAKKVWLNREPLIHVGKIIEINDFLSPLKSVLLPL